MYNVYCCSFKTLGFKRINESKYKPSMAKCNRTTELLRSTRKCASDPWTICGLCIALSFHYLVIACYEKKIEIVRLYV